MKKLFVWILILAMILSLVSCSGANIPTKEGSADQGTPAESKPVSGEEGTGESRETEPGGDPVADLPDGFSPIDTAVPSEAFPSSVSYETLAGEQVRVDLRARLYQSGAERPFLLLLAVRSPCLAAGGAGDAKKGKEEGDDGAHGKSIAFLSFACLACPSWWFAVVWRLVNLPGPALTRGENLPIFMRKESMP